MIDIPARPFSRELITGLMLPDGIFESTLGNQELVAGFRNGGADTAIEAYVESTSHPALVVTPATRSIPNLVAGATTYLAWRVDVTAVPPGEHRVSFVIDTPAGRERRIKKIFVTQVLFDPATKTFTGLTPQGRLDVVIETLRGPADQPCCPPVLDGTDRKSYLEYVREAFTGHDPDFNACFPGYLFDRLSMAMVPASPFAGQFGPLPFEDPWWKVVLCIIAVLLLVAASLVAAFGGGGGSVSVTAGGGAPSGSPAGDCCGVRARGGSSDYVVAGLVAAAAAAATAAALSDVRDPFRRGEENTVPAEEELTTGETVEATFSYPEPVALGRPFHVQADWKYARITTGSTYTFGASDDTANVHVLTDQRISAPDVVRAYKEEPFVVEAEFRDAVGELFTGPDLYVQCILAGPHGEYVAFRLTDDAVGVDSAVDGTYTGRHWFSGRDAGIWLFYVIAQDVNQVADGTAPEVAAQTIGGIVVSQNISITFDGGDCPLVADGHVQVIAA